MRNTTIGHRVHVIKHKFMHSLGLPFRCILPEHLFEEALAAEGGLLPESAVFACGDGVGVSVADSGPG